MERNRISAGVGRIIALALFGSLVACDFEPDVPNIPWPTPPERPFGGFSSRPENPGEASEAGLGEAEGQLPGVSTSLFSGEAERDPLFHQNFILHIVNPRA